MLPMIGFISMPGGWEYILIFVIILVIFGPKSLPKIGKAIGHGIREFKDASEGLTRAIEEETSRAERSERESSRSAETTSPPADESDGASPAKETDESHSTGETDETSQYESSGDEPPDRQHAD